VSLLPRLTGWRRALAIILGAQLLFWGAYALIVAGLQPAGTLERYRIDLIDKATAEKLNVRPSFWSRAMSTRQSVSSERRWASDR